MKNFKNPTNDLENQAAEWSVKLADGLSAEDEQAFEQWHEANPGAEAVLEKYMKTWKRFEILNPQDFEDLDIDTCQTKDKNTHRPSFKKWVWTFGAAAAIALIGIGIQSTSNQIDHEIFAQQTLSYSESDFYKLEDGSTVDLNEGAQVVCKYSENRREIWIKSGEAYFTVAKDPNRPFDVYAGETMLRAVGTEFNVKYQKTAIEVLVTEGIVELSILSPEISESSEQPAKAATPTANLTVNQKAVVSRDPDIEKGYIIEDINADSASELIYWKPVTLKFDSTPLSEVVKAFNSRNEDQLVIADARIESMLIVATFRSNKLEGFINLLQATSNIVAKRDGKKIVLSERN